MYAQTDHITQRRSLSQNLRNGYVWPFQSRHRGTVAAIRITVAMWLIILGTVLCSNGYWWGSLIFAVAALHLALAYRLLKTSKAR